MGEVVRAVVSDGGEEHVTVSIEGSLDGVGPGAAGILGDALVHDDGRTVILDLHQVNRLGALGVVKLGRLVRSLQARGHEVRIRAPEVLHGSLTSFGQEIERPEAPETGLHLIERLGERTILLGDAAVRYLVLFSNALKHALLQPFRSGRRRGDLTLRASVRMGVTATPLVALIAFLIGVILALQAGVLLRQYGQALRIADLVGLSLTKEIGPLLTAVLVAGRSGSSLTAEIGTMRVSEEVDALTVMGVDPVEYLVAPRLRALAVVLPILTIIADVVGIGGGLIIATTTFGVTPEAYIAQTTLVVQPVEVLGGLMKALLFSLVIVSVAAHQGFSTAGGAAGVGKFTTRSVVQAIMWIIVVDAIFTTVQTFLEW